MVDHPALAPPACTTLARPKRLAAKLFSHLVHDANAATKHLTALHRGSIHVVSNTVTY
jgi:hypothetical protein